MKSLLSIPIFDGEKMVIGVIQMMNKLNGKPFAENDRNSLEVVKPRDIRILHFACIVPVVF